MRWVFLWLCLSRTVFAGDFIDLLSDQSQSRPSSIALSGEYGQGGRFGFGLAPTFGLNEAWQIFGSGTFTQFDSSSRYWDARVGADYLCSQTFQLTFSVMTSLSPPPRKRFGSDVLASIWLNSETVLKLGGGYSVYGPRILNEFSFSARLWRAIGKSFSVEAAYTGYAYDVPASMMTRTDRTIPTSSYGSVTVFPAGEARLSVGWAEEVLGLGASFFRTKAYAGDSVYWGVSPYIDVFLNRSLVFSVRATGTRSGDTSSYLIAPQLELWY